MANPRDKGKGHFPLRAGQSEIWRGMEGIGGKRREGGRSGMGGARSGRELKYGKRKRSGLNPQEAGSRSHFSHYAFGLRQFLARVDLEGTN